MKRYLTLIAVVLVLTPVLGTGCGFQERAAGIDNRITTLEQKVEALEQQIEALIE